MLVDAEPRSDGVAGSPAGGSGGFVGENHRAIAFQPSKEQEIFELMQKAVALRNELIAKVSNPTEPHNKSLVRKYYAALRADIVRSFEALFEELSKINEAKK